MRCDIAVIGAGSAGGVVAARLSEEPDLEVVLIEAGPDYPHPSDIPAEIKYGHATASYAETHGHLWGFEAQANEVQEPTELPRGKVVGGTSAINGQVFLRGLQEDFSRWSELTGDNGWSFNGVLPFFKKLETDLDFDNKWHGSSGPIAVHRYPTSEWLPPQAAFYEACLDLGYEEAMDANEPGVSGVSPLPFNNIDGVRGSTLVTYLAAARPRPNLTILSNSLARRLRIRNGRVTGLEVGSRADLVEAREYVLCAGSVGSPHLLMLSGIGPADVLRPLGITVVADRPGVGRHLQDHQVVDMVWNTPSTTQYDSQSPRVQVGLRYTSRASMGVDDMQITPRTSAPGQSDESTVSFAPCIELSASEGEMTLVSRDPEVQPRIALRFLSEPVDRERLGEAVDRCLHIASSRAFARILGTRLSPTDEDLRSTATLESWLLSNVRTSHHSCGTCKMGQPSDSYSVVGEAGRVHGIDNLRIADASIFPEVIRANLNATTMMVGERIAALIKSDF